MSAPTRRQTGFTIIEMMIYIGIIAVVSLIFSHFIVSVVRTSTRVFAVQEINQNARVLLTRIGQEVKTASQILSLTADELRVLNTSGTQLRFYLHSSTRRAYVEIGGVSEPLTTQNVRVDQLSFINASGDAIVITATISSTNPQYAIQKTLRTTVVPRELVY